MVQDTCRGGTFAARYHGTNSVEDFFLARAQLLSGSERACYPRHKEVEGVRQQEEQEDKRDEEIGDEVHGEVEEVTQHTHETWR